MQISANNQALHASSIFKEEEGVLELPGKGGGWLDFIDS